MKRTFITILVILFACSLGQSQDEQLFKPTKGKIGIELNFNPFTATPFSMDYLRTRLWLTDNIALRAGLNLDFRSESPSDNTDNFTHSRNYFQFGLFPGIEWHVGHMEKISPYFGAELGVEFKTASETSTDKSTNPTVTESLSGAWAGSYTYDTATGTVHITGFTNQGYVRLVLAGLAGVDIYFTKHAYVGAELGFGLDFISYATITLDNGTTSVKEQNSSSAIEIGFWCHPAIRFGWHF